MQWEDTATRAHVDITRMPGTASTQYVWGGLALYHVRNDDRGQEVPEGHYLNHMLAWRRSDPVGEYFIPGSSWRRFSWCPLVFVPAHMPYSVRWRGPSDVVAIELTPDFISACRGKTDHAMASSRFFSTEDPLLIEIVRALWIDARSDAPRGELYAHSLGAALVAHVLKQCHLGDSSDGAAALSPGVLRQVIEYVSDNLEHDVRLDDLARVAGTGMNRFVRCFKHSTGMSPYQYVVRARIERARTLLANCSLPMTEIAARTGFADQSHFSNTFRRMTGLSPRVYRNTIR